MNDAAVDKAGAATTRKPADVSGPLVLGVLGGKLIVAVPGRSVESAYPLELMVNGKGEYLAPRGNPALSRPVAYNLLFDSQMKTGKSQWQLVEGGAASLGIDLSEQWILKDGHTAYISQRPADLNITYVARYTDPVSGTQIRVPGNGRFQLSGYFGLHRCQGRIEVEFFDRNKKSLGTQVVSLATEKQGGVELDGYFALQDEFVTPGQAAVAELRLVKTPTAGGSKDSFLFFTDIRLSHVPALAEALDLTDVSPQLLHAVRRAVAEAAEFVALPIDFHKLGTAELQLEVRCGVQRAQAAGSPLSLPARVTISGEIEQVNGWVVEGKVSIALLSSTDQRLWLYVDDTRVSSMIPKERAGSDHMRFRLPLTPELMDGRPHLITVLTADGQTIGQLATVLPFMLTPWQSMEKYAARPLPAPLSPVAAHRYEALRATFQLLDERSRAGADPAQLLRQAAQVSRMHMLLVEGHATRVKDATFDFPQHADPEVSVIVPVHNKWPVTRHCLAGLLVAANRASFEVIVVDDGSEDDTRDLPNVAPNISYVRNEKALGFVLSCNRGAEKARGKYVVFLNNDTEPTAGWLDELVYVFENFEDIGLAGSKLLYPDGRLQEAGGIVWGTGDPWNYGRNANPNDPRYCYLRQADYVSGASMMLPRELWQKIGGFSEELAPAYFEDTDLAFKVRHAGRKVVYAAQSVVYHYEGLSSGTSTSSGMKRFQEINRPKFKRKWAKAFANNGEVGKNIDLAKDRGIRGRALVIDAAPPRPYNDAGSYAAIQEIRLLQSLGFKVTFLPQNLAYLGGDSNRLQRMGVETLHSPYFLAPADVFEKRGAEFDVIYITRYYIAHHFLWMIRRWAPQAKVLFCNADLHFLRQMREAILSNDENQLKAAHEIREKELAVCRDVDAILSYSYVEHAVLEGHGIPKSKIVTCPWVVEVSQSVPSFESRRDIAYLGGFGHGPNKKAVMYFVDEVLPLLRLQLPDVNLRVFGSGSADALTELDRDGVIVEGWVENVAEVYDRCRVFVAPLLTGAGLKGKVVGALAHGLPSVISSIAAEGTSIRDGEEAFIADRPDRGVERLVTLYNDEIVWNQMSAKAQQLAASRFNFEEGRKLMAQALEAAGVFLDSTLQGTVVTTVDPT